MDIKFMKIEEKDLHQYKADMQEAFQLGAAHGGCSVDDNELILPEEDIDNSLGQENAIAYKAVLDGEMVGGAIVVSEKPKRWGHLDFLYVKHGIQGKGIGKFMWFEIERLHPEIEVWETCTPYFEVRNIHFYINVCGFHAVEFFNRHHPDPNEPNENVPDNECFEGMFRFEKTVRYHNRTEKGS